MTTHPPDGYGEGPELGGGIGARAPFYSPPLSFIESGQNGLQDPPKMAESGPSQSYRRLPLGNPSLTRSTILWKGQLHVHVQSSFLSWKSTVTSQQRTLALYVQLMM